MRQGRPGRPRLRRAADHTLSCAGGGRDGLASLPKKQKKRCFLGRLASCESCYWRKM